MRPRLNGVPSRALVSPCARRVLHFAQLGQDLPHARIREAGHAHRPVRELTRGHFAARRARACFQERRDLLDGHEISRHGQKAFAFRSRMGHRAQVQVGDIAHIHDAEVEPRDAGHGAVEQTLDEERRARQIGTEHRPKHRNRIDDGELERPAFARDETSQAARSASVFDFV